MKPRHLPTALAATLTLLMADAAQACSNGATNPPQCTSLPATPSPTTSPPASTPSPIGSTPSSVSSQSNSSLQSTATSSSQSTSTSASHAGASSQASGVGTGYGGAGGSSSASVAPITSSATNTAGGAALTTSDHSRTIGYVFPAPVFAAPLPAGLCPKGDSVSWSIGWNFFSYASSSTRTELECLDRVLASLPRATPAPEPQLPPMTPAEREELQRLERRMQKLEQAPTGGSVSNNTQQSNNAETKAQSGAASSTQRKPCPTGWVRNSKGVCYDPKWITPSASTTTTPDCNAPTVQAAVQACTVKPRI